MELLNKRTSCKLLEYGRTPFSVFVSAAKVKGNINLRADFLEKESSSAAVTLRMCGDGYCNEAVMTCRSSPLNYYFSTPQTVYMLSHIFYFTKQFQKKDKYSLMFGIKQ